MRHTIFLTAAGLLLAACAAPDPIGDGFGPSTESARPIDVHDRTATRAALDSAPWTPYRTFDFDSAKVDVSISDMPKIYDIVSYLKSNPSLDVGIDETPVSERIGEAGSSLANRRAASLRRALMDAGGGVASYKIFIGAFAQPSTRRAGQIQVLVGQRSGSLRTAGW